MSVQLDDDLVRVVVAPITRTVRGISSELSLGPGDGLGEECAANFDALLMVPKTRLIANPRRGRRAPPLN